MPAPRTTESLVARERSRLSGTESGTNPNALTHDARDPRELAGFYRLLSELYAREADEDLLAAAAGVPALRPHATPEAAARHTHVFVLNVYPFASIYLDEGGTMHGERAAFTRDVLQAVGLRLAERVGLAADHVAVALDALAALLEREAAATTVVHAQRARHAQRTVLSEHLLSWAPPFLGAVERIDGRLYGAAATLTRTLLARHVAWLDGSGEEPPGSSGLGEAGRVVREEDAPPTMFDLLASPIRCGMFLSCDDLSLLARAADVPTRVGGRRFVLEDLLSAASDEWVASDLRTALLDFTRARRGELEVWARAMPSFPGAWQPWLERLAATEARLGGGPSGANGG